VVEFQRDLDSNVGKLSAALRGGSYEPSAIRRVFIPKPGSSEPRPLGIPTVRDRTVVEGDDSSENDAVERPEFASDPRERDPNAGRLVRILQAQLSLDVPGLGRLDPNAFTEPPSPAFGQAGPGSGRGSSGLFECFLYAARELQSGSGSSPGVSIPVRVKPPTGKPDAGDPPVRFGGRGDRRRSSLPYRDLSLSG